MEIYWQNIKITEEAWRDFSPYIVMKSEYTIEVPYPQKFLQWFPKDGRVDIL